MPRAHIRLLEPPWLEEISDPRFAYVHHPSAISTSANNVNNHILESEDDEDDLRKEDISFMGESGPLTPGRSISLTPGALLSGSPAQLGSGNRRFGATSNTPSVRNGTPNRLATASIEPGMMMAGKIF